MNQRLAQQIEIGVGRTNFDPTTPGAPTPTGVQIVGPLKGGINNIGDVITIILNTLYPIAALLLLAYLMWTGFALMQAGGDPEKIQAAKARATAAVIGFILLILAVLIAKLIARVVGIDQSLF